MHFLYLDRFLKKLVNDQCSSITKGSIYCITHMSIQLFIVGVDWSEIGCFKYLLCWIFAHAAFLLCRAVLMEAIKMCNSYHRESSHISVDNLWIWTFQPLDDGKPLVDLCEDINHRTGKLGMLWTLGKAIQFIPVDGCVDKVHWESFVLS